MRKVLLFLSAILALSASALTYNVEVPAGTKACYIAGNMNNWSHQEMTKVDATHYTIDIAGASESDKYKYSSGPGWNYVEKNADGSEMQDRSYSANDVVARWASVYDPGTGEVKPEGDISIYLQVEGAYSPANLYVWDSATSATLNGSWPGTAMTTIENVSGVDYYVTTFTKPANAINIIFNNGQGNQTADILGITKTTYYRLSGNTAIEVTPGVVEEDGVTYNVTVPDGTPACYIAGEMNNWSFTQMEMVDETHYTITIANATKSMKYKYCASASWDNVEMKANGKDDVQDRTYSENDVVEAWKGISTQPETPETLVYDVTVPAGTPACYIAGDMNSWSFTAMTKVDETHYTITFDNVTKSTQYKYTCGEGWEYVEVQADGSDVGNRSWSDADVVAAWKTAAPQPETPETLVYDVTVPAGTPACYIAGDMNSWSFTAMTKVDETHYTITFDNVTKSTQYKYTCGEGWDYVEVQADGSDMGNRSWSDADVVAAWKTVASQPETPGTLVYNVTVPDGTYACYIAGGMNDWTFTEMTKVDENHYTIAFDNVTKSTEYKYFCGPEFTYAECLADGTFRGNRTWAENDVVENWETWSSVAGVETTDAKVFGANDVLCIRTTKEISLNIYNAQGMLVKAVVVDGDADINLAAGLYIVNGVKVLVY